MQDAETAPETLARNLLRSLDRAALATRMAEGGEPYASLVLTACDHDASPLLLISELAEHTRNIDADGRASLLFDSTAGLESPLTGARISLQGRARRDDAPHLRERFVARHPDAAMYAGFTDFHLYRVEAERLHLVAGFGRIHWLAAADVLLPADAVAGFREWEGGVVGHMNEDHANAIDLYATKLLGGAGEGWRMTGCDPDGCDLRLGGKVLRLPFTRRIGSPREAREELVALVGKARGDS